MTNHVTAEKHINMIRFPKKQIAPMWIYLCHEAILGLLEVFCKRSIPVTQKKEMWILSNDFGHNHSLFTETFKTIQI